MAVLLAAMVGVLSLLAPASTAAQDRPPAQSTKQKAKPMTAHATGDFAVKLNPDGDLDKAEGATLGRMTIDKQFHGDLEGTSRGQMLTAMTDVKGSAGYVAIERITGPLQGRTGSFVMQHSGTISVAGPVQSITIVPDSGTGQLVGISGQMIIKIADGKHSYDLEYKLPEAH